MYSMHSSMRAAPNSGNFSRSSFFPVAIYILSYLSSFSAQTWFSVKVVYTGFIAIQTIVKQQFKKNNAAA